MVRVVSQEEAEAIEGGLADYFDFDDDAPSACYGINCDNDALPDDVLCASCRDEVDVDVDHDAAIEEDQFFCYMQADHDEALVDAARLAQVQPGSDEWRAISQEW